MITAAVDELRPFQTIHGLQVVCKTHCNHLVKHPHVFDTLEQAHTFSTRIHQHGAIQLNRWDSLDEFEAAELQQIMS